MPDPGHRLPTTDRRIALISVLLSALALYPAYAVFLKDDPAPSSTTVSTGNSTTVISATDTTGTEPTGDNTTTRPRPPPTRPPTTRLPGGGAAFTTTIDIGEGLDIDRRRRSSGLAVGVDLVNSGGSIDYKGAELALAPVAMSGTPTQQDCATAYQQAPNTWPTIRFDVFGEGQDFCIVTDAGRLAAFRIEKLPAGPTTSLVRLAVVVWG